MFRTSRNLISVGIFVAISALAYVSATPQGSSSTFDGIVVDDKTPISGARITVTQAGSSSADEASSDAEGKFSLATTKAGACLLRVHKNGYADSEVPVTLPLANAAPLRISLARMSEDHASAAGMQFSDKPDFTVAGITDWTAAGGHGSDVNLRASESLARETGALGSTSPSFPVHDAERERSLRVVAAKEPTSFQANYALGKFCLNQRHFADAVPPLERAHQLQPDDFQAAYDLAQGYEGAGRHEKAKALVQQLIASRDRAELRHSLGDIEEALNNPLASEREYERAVQLEPSEDNYFAWGSELLRHRAVEAAIDVFTKGAGVSPHSERMLAALGAALYAHGSYEAGAQRVCEASDLKPADPEPYLFLGKMEQASPRPLPCV
ncbi:MAG TPA: carboxypeptidase regulatory-like domain-containing protein, partial [Terriglobales bacterium]